MFPHSAIPLFRVVLYVVGLVGAWFCFDERMGCVTNTVCWWLGKSFLGYSCGSITTNSNNDANDDDDDDDNNNDNYYNNNNNDTARCNSRFVIFSTLHIMCNLPATHRALITCKMLCATCLEGTAQV